LPAGSVVYAVGDIHGRLDLLEQMHEKIEADAARAEVSRKVLIYLGDYVDRGPDSRGVVDLLIREPLAGLETVHLIGNHEDFLLSFLEDPQRARVWFMNGGDATLRSYGVEPSAVNRSENFADGLRDSFLERLPASHLDFFNALSLSHEEGGYLFVHAGVRPGVALEHQAPEDLVWIRDEFLSSKAHHGRVIVHGHSAMRAPKSLANRIGIDTGAVYGGKLTSVVLEGPERRFIQV
jgi:serine/threonine protein phosphatase 1